MGCRKNKLGITDLESCLQDMKIRQQRTTGVDASTTMQYHNL